MKHQLIFIHGIGNGESTEEYESLFQGISRAYQQETGISKKEFVQLFEPVFVNWQKVTYDAERCVFMNSFPDLAVGGGILGNISDWNPMVVREVRALRYFMTFFLGDIIAYTSPKDNGIRRAVWNDISTPLQTRDIPFSIIAHSLGSVVAFDFLTTLLNPENQGCEAIFVTKGESPRINISREKVNQIKRNFRHLFTMGAPINLFFLKSLQQGNLASIKNPIRADKNQQWINFYDYQDVVAFPLKQLFSAADNDINSIEEVVVQTGSMVIDSHTAYWQNKTVAKKIAQTLKDSVRTELSQKDLSASTRPTPVGCY